MAEAQTINFNAHVVQVPESALSNPNVRVNINGRAITSDPPAPPFRDTRPAAANDHANDDHHDDHPEPSKSAESWLGALLLTAMVLAIVALILALLYWNGAFRSAGAAASAPAGCKNVRIERDDVGPSTGQITVRFRSESGSGGVDGIESCLSGGTVISHEPDRNGGTKVRLSIPSGAAEVALPNSFVRGTADQVVCRIMGDPHRKYAASWTGGLPDTIRLRKLDSYDRASADTNCASVR